MVRSAIATPDWFRNRLVRTPQGTHRRWHKIPAQTKEVDLFASHRWERSLTDLQNPAHGDSLIPMFESMVDRAFSRTRADYPAKEAATEPAVQTAIASSASLQAVLPRTRRMQ